MAEKSYHDLLWLADSNNLNPFKDELLFILGQDGINAATGIAAVILKDTEHSEFYADVLEQIGRLEYYTTRCDTFRRAILELCLVSKSSWIRDGAVRGLSYLDDAKALKALQSAHERETSQRIADYMQRVIERFSSDK